MPDLLPRLPNAARQRSGSSIGCTTLGLLQPSDDAIYFCFTAADDGFTWTYLLENQTNRSDPSGSRGRCKFCIDSGEHRGQGNMVKT